MLCDGGRYGDEGTYGRYRELVERYAVELKEWGNIALIAVDISLCRGNLAYVSLNWADMSI